MIVHNKPVGELGVDGNNQTTTRHYNNERGIVQIRTANIEHNIATIASSSAVVRSSRSARRETCGSSVAPLSSIDDVSMRASNSSTPCRATLSIATPSSLSDDVDIDDDDGVVESRRVANMRSASHALDRSSSTSLVDNDDDDNDGAGCVTS